MTESRTIIAYIFVVVLIVGLSLSLVKRRKQEERLNKEAQKFSAWYASFGKHKPEKKEVLWYFAVLLKNGTEYAWNHRNKESLSRPFLHWYFGRPQSEHFMMEYDNGKRLLRRAEIASFSIYSKYER